MGLAPPPYSPYSLPIPPMALLWDPDPPTPLFPSHSSRWAPQWGPDPGHPIFPYPPPRFSIESKFVPTFPIYSPILYVGLMDYMQDYCIICRNYCIIFRIIVLYLGLLYDILIFVLYLRYCRIFNLLYYM